jgi:isoquinoline 1-oxidoreductase alpha subunit
VNGQPFGTEADGETALLWVLRDEAHLKGTKFGCGIGTAAPAPCTWMAAPCARASRRSAVAGSAITTIEGLSPDGTHPLQRRGSPRRRPSAASASRARSCRRPPAERYPQPTDANIDAVMSGNLPLHGGVPHPQGHQAGGRMAAGAACLSFGQTAERGRRRPPPRRAGAAS